MIGLALSTLALLQQAPITTQTPREVGPRSRPRYEVACELRDLDFARNFRIALSQYGGIYSQRDGDGLGGRSPTYVRFSQDDLGIFDDQDIDLTAMRVTDWYSDGPIELVAKNGAGAITLYKTTEQQAWFESPTKIAVTVKGGRRVRSDRPDRTWEEFMLVGSCDVAWERQGEAPAVSQDRASQ